VAKLAEGAQVAPRPAADIQDCERRRAVNMAQQRRDVLADIVIAGAFAKIFCTLVVMFQRQGGNVFEIGRQECHAR
jgi:hypothetical protein